ncbi:MAG: hypothetical protein PHF86_08785 [Candidatus Nanoarchaeia archaeon]|nr:hypothetical protein [Candidatus Nanoarchaeia archaeon]
MKCGRIKAHRPKFELIDLLRIPHKGKYLTVSYHAFGPNNFKDNVARMKQSYFHPKPGKVISFREPTTSESISVIAYDFEHLAKPKLQRSFQIGYIVKISEGVFANPPKDKQGNPIIDENILKSYLNNIKKVNGIYLCENDFGFAPYDSFKQGLQDGNAFAKGGLARLLEHTSEKTAKNFNEIASSKFYKDGVNVSEFEFKDPILNVVSLYSDWFSSNNILFVGKYFLGIGGSVFGVLNKGVKNTKK